MSQHSDLISFGEWLPDLPALNNPGMVSVVNAVPSATSYLQAPGPEFLGGALNGRALSAHWAIGSGGGTTGVFAGTPTTLYRKNATGGWDDVSKTGSYTGVNRWEMASFGHRLIAVSGTDVPQYYDVGVSAAFADLPNAPTATAVGLVRDFVVLGDISTLGENFIQWSGFNNSESWSPSKTTQSDFQPLSSEGGKVQSIVSGSVGHIFLENSVYRMEYIGPPRIFKLDEISPGRGTLAPQSTARVGPYIFYCDVAGFYRLDTRNGEFTAIGQNKVDRFLRAKVPPSCALTMQAAVDPRRKLIVWAFCTSEGAPSFSNMAAYNYELDRWTMFDVASDCISLLPTPSASLDELDTFFTEGIDAQAFSVDSDLFSGGALIFSMFGPAHTFGTLTGPPLTAKFVTAENSALMNDRIGTKEQRPYIHVHPGATDSRVRIAYRDELSERPSLTQFSDQNANGRTFVRKKSRFQQYELEVSGGFDDVIGLEVFRRGA